jgi:uncharacterized SAM-binding protein YcdF (DUF218 family)
VPFRPAGARKRRPSAWLWLARIVALPVLGWCLGLIWFSLALPGAAPLSARTDGVVVLTGGVGRFRRGLAVVESGSARRMLVSGVGAETSRRDLAGAFGVATRRLRTTDLGYEAIDTRSNAEETARWVASHKFTSIRLVTSAAHMPRARLELARVRERYSAVSSSGAIKLISDRNWGSIRREHFPMHGSWRAKAEALLAHLPDNWGDEVVDGQIMLRVDSDAIDAAMEKP